MTAPSACSRMEKLYLVLVVATTITTFLAAPAHSLPRGDRRRTNSRMMKFDSLPAMEEYTARRETDRRGDFIFIFRLKQE